MSKSFKNILLPILFQINSPPPTSMLCGMECCLGVYRMKRKEQVLTRIYTKTKQLIVSKKILKMVNFGARNISDFYFHFRSLLPQDLIKLDQKTCPMLSITKIVIKIFLLYSCLKTSLFLKKKKFFFKTISHKFSQTNRPPHNFNVVWGIDCIWVDSFCHLFTIKH